MQPYCKQKNEPYSVMWFVGEGREVNVHTLEMGSCTTFSIFFVPSPVVVFLCIFPLIFHICGPWQRGLHFPVYIYIYVCVYMCVCECVHAYMCCVRACLCVYIYTYILAAYSWHCPSNVNMKHYRGHSNFIMVGPSISFWQPKQLPVGVANTNPHIHCHTHMWIMMPTNYLDSISQFLPD